METIILGGLVTEVIVSASVVVIALVSVAIRRN